MSKDRMMATTYRFEINKGKSCTGQMLEQSRIQQHEEEEQNALMKKRQILEGFKTDWNNNFDELNKVYSLRNHKKHDHDELKILRRANLIARRDALRELLRDETKNIESDLNRLGLTFRKERL